VAEGVKVVEAAIDAGAPIEAIYIAPAAEEAPGASGLVERAEAAGIRIVRLQRGVIERVADTVTPQPVIAVVGRVDLDMVDAMSRCGDDAPVVVCIDVRDPGNLGAIIRSADAAGAAAVVCCEGSADVYNPKTVRATAGSLFHVPLVVDVSERSAYETLRGVGYTLLGTVAHGGEDYARANLPDRVAIVLGNEANGLHDEARAALDASVAIPMAGRAESLNVAMAATVLLFELARRRRLDPKDNVRWDR